MSQLPYFAPTYFTTFYFPDLTAIEVSDPSFPPSVTPTIPRPVATRAIEVIARRLRELGIFRCVLAADDPSAIPSVPGYPVAVVSIKNWSDEEENSTDTLRTVAFAIRLIDEQDQPFSRIESLIALAEATRLQIQHSDLDGLVMPGLTRLRAGRFAKETTFPDGTLLLDGEFSYLLEPIAVIAVQL